MANEQVHGGSSPSSTSRAAQGRSNSAATSVPASQSRRLVEPLDESGAPVGKQPATKTATPAPAGATAAGQAKMNNAAIAPERTIDDEIRLRAYERFLARQGAPGDPHDDWCCAEREVKEKLWPKKGVSEPGL